MDAVEIFQDLVVPEPQNALALVLKELGSLGFAARRAIVLATVDFHNQPGVVANKIANIAADRHLAELVPFYLTRAQYSPDTLLGLGHALP